MPNQLAQTLATQQAIFAAAAWLVPAAMFIAVAVLGLLTVRK